MHNRARRNLTWPTSLAAVVAAAALAAASMGCQAGVKKGSGNPGSSGSSGGPGSGGGSGSGPAPIIANLTGLQVQPPSITIDLTEANGTITPANAQFQAIGTFADGSTQDVSNKVVWPSSLLSLTISNGNATVTAPGTYTITAKANTFTATAQLVANFTGSFVNVPDAQKTSLDGNPSGSAQIAYPLDGALFPRALGPLYVQINHTGTAARLSFKGDGLDVTFYGPCDTTVPGSGCSVKVPTEFQSLFIAASENGDIQLSARVGGTGAPVETAAVNVAWSNVKLTGGLYYWTVIVPGAVPGYTSPEMPAQPNGTGILRYDFDAGDPDNPAPQVVWTDRGAPPFGTTVMAPQSFNATANPPYGSHCIGCHAITSDGKYMALTLGGSSSGQTDNGSNWSLLDISAKNLFIINPGARMDLNSTPLVDPSDYWKQFRNNGFATETTWAPNDTMSPTYYMVSMFQSKLYLNTVGIAGVGTATPARAPAQVVPSWNENESDPFWSPNGDFLAFTSFAGPDVGVYNTTGLNGDMKNGSAGAGQIAAATATPTSVNDDAIAIVPRQAGITSFYPSINSDSKLLVYNQSKCTGGTDLNKATSDYGSQTCDGYDDWTSELWLTVPNGGRTPQRLDKANGTAPAGNSWPRWSPDSGSFRGQTLYWIAFSSRRPYGVQVNDTTVPTATKPQLWFAGVVTGGEFQGDPSFAPVWLPGQNTTQSAPNGNHVPQWVKVAVIIPM